ncbi:hypothetical protein RB595_004138 [Gaeumannomyces hyphopodioides]
MKFTICSAVAVVFAASCVTATPMALPSTSVESGLSPRAASIGLTADEFLKSNGTCRDVTLLYARGSIQPGNLGGMPGTTLADKLRERLGADRIAIQGVPFRARMRDNFDAGGAGASDGRAFAELITNVTVACPRSKIVLSGYSQGAALVHVAVRDMPASVLNNVRATVTFGDTRKEQDGGAIPPLPQDDTLILCRRTDLTCKGTLVVTPSHLSYNGKVPEAVDFIAKRVA